MWISDPDPTIQNLGLRLGFGLRFELVYGQGLC